MIDNVILWVGQNPVLAIIGTIVFIFVTLIIVVSALVLYGGWLLRHDDETG